MTASPDLVAAVEALASRTRAAFDGDAATTLMIGINGPQGAGKSTLASAVVARARARGERAVAISVDDFYLTRAEQTALAARHPGNPYLEHRGYPGTHDVALGSATLRALRRAGSGDVVELPTYDKSAHRGRGDRAPRSAWPRVSGPIGLVVLEGWMLGFPAVATDGSDRALSVAASHVLKYAPWHRELDAFVHLEADDLARIVEWRIDAERARRAAGATSLTDAEARDYIERFLPAYRLWVPALRADPPARDGRPLPAVWARLGADRNPSEIVER